MRSNILEISGWIGVAIVLGSYALLSLGIVDGQSMLYHTLVFIGSLALAIISWYKHTYQPAVLNIVFCVLAVVAMVRIIIM